MEAMWRRCGGDVGGEISHGSNHVRFGASWTKDRGRLCDILLRAPLFRGSENAKFFFPTPDADVPREERPRG